MVAQVSYRGVRPWSRVWVLAASTANSMRRTAASSVDQQHSRCYSVPTSHSGSEPQWRYKTDSYIRKRVSQVADGSGNNTTAITFNAARPVTPDLCQDVLMHLYRTVEALRVCFRECDGELWVAVMDTPKIDFQVVEGGPIEDVTKITSLVDYNTTEGPLWRVRLVVCKSDDPCMLPQVKEAFPYQYHLVLDMHHAVHDGLCVMVILQIFLKTLDSMLDRVQVDDRQIGEFRDRNEVRAAEASIRESLEKDPHRLKEMLEERHKTLTRVPLITEAFGESKESPPDTNSLAPEILDHKLLQVFIAKCKARKVTFNSGIDGVMRVALMELAREAGVVRDSYMISIRHQVNTRRYMSDVTSMVWGYHNMPMSLDMATPSDARNKFWKHVVDIDTKFHERIRKMGPVEDLVLDTILQPMIPNHGNKTIYDMMLTNMWTPMTKLIGNGKHVQLTNFQGYTSLNYLEHKIFYAIIESKNGVQSQFLYSPQFITKVNAAKLSKRMTTLFNDIAKSVD